MPQLEYFVICGDVSVDQATNRISLFNIVEEIVLPKFPGVTIPLVAVSSWNREPSNGDTDYQVILRVCTPNDEKDFPMNFKMPKKRHRTFQYISGIPVIQAGELKFNLLLNGQHTASHTITVDKIPENVTT